jgi:hypothetical protein
MKPNRSMTTGSTSRKTTVAASVEALVERIVIGKAELEITFLASRRPGEMTKTQQARDSCH